MEEMVVEEEERPSFLPVRPPGPAARQPELLQEAALFLSHKSRWLPAKTQLSFTSCHFTDAVCSVVYEGAELKIAFAASRQFARRGTPVTR